MSFVNYSTREVNVKVAYVPANCGSLVLDALSYIYERTDPDSRSKKMVFPVDGGVVAFFDFVPVRAGRVANWTARLHVYGTSSLTEGVQQVLSGADGVVVVVDASSMETAEREVLRLREAMAGMGFDEETPLVFQFDSEDGGRGHSDMPKKRLPVGAAVCRDSVIRQGVGVVDTARHLWGAIRARLNASGL